MTSTTPINPSGKSRQVLDAAVRIATGSTKHSPRPGQIALLADIVNALDHNTHASCEAPTGVGKSLAYLVPAAVAAVERGERTVVSTESLALQSQIIDKDAPTVQEACMEVLNAQPSVAVLKGWGNYVCLNRAYNQGLALLDELGMTPNDKSFTGVTAALTNINADLDDFADALPEGTLRVEENYYKIANVVPLLIWSLNQSGNDTGDKHSFTGNITDRDWNAVAVSPTECVGLDTCPFADECRPAMARELAADADIVVTNHSMLAVQAANDAPVVIGNNKLGRFDHILIDEAHTLPSAVRDQGSTEISGRKIRGVLSSIRHVLDEAEGPHQQLLDAGSALADIVDRHLEEETSSLQPGGVLRLKGEDNPVEAFADPISAWLKMLNKELSRIAESSSSNLSLKARRAKTVVNGQQSAIRSVSEDRPGTARWLEKTRPMMGAKHPRSYSIVRYTPVDVAPMMSWNLWSAPDKEAEPLESDSPTEDIVPRYNLSVVALSATMPNGFAAQMGMKAQTKQYESPFESAYANSMLYVPRAVDPIDLQALCPASWDQSRPRLDTRAHTEWAAKHILELVITNGGSALVLAATAEAGKKYAAYLQKALDTGTASGFTVMSQWGGDALRRTTSKWREDHHAVLVGTRSLMTGVDAPGDTCSLVIVDRIPRAAGNPVDDARVDAIVERLEIDKWAADRLVYALDAALLLEQSAGRLIRSVSDTGMVAVLDPRLLKVGPLAYNAQTRKIYLDALARFSQRASTIETATDFLAQRTRRPAA